MNTYNIGDVIITKNNSKNPYTEFSYSGNNRKWIINNWRSCIEGTEINFDSYDFWIAPASGGAFKFNPKSAHFINDIVVEIN